MNGNNTLIVKQKRNSLIIIAAGVALWVISAFSNTTDFGAGVLSGMSSALCVIGVARIAKLIRLEKNEDKLADYLAQYSDERILQLSEKARALSFAVAVCMEVAASLVCTFVISNNVLSQVFAYMACIQLLVYVIAYWIYNRKY